MVKRGRSTRKKADISKVSEVITGYIEHVIFPGYGRESKGGFAILAVALSGESRKAATTDGVEIEDPNRIVAKGVMPHPKKGDEVELRGEWVSDPTYGQQFAFAGFDVILPTNQQGVVAYFSGGDFYGLGRKAAEKILAALGENCLNLLKENPALAYEVGGLSQKQQAELAEQMAEHGALGDLIAMICRHGIGTSTAGRVYAKYGMRSLDIVKENPYQLIKDVDGIGFDKADKIGGAVGIRKDSEFRIQAGIRHVLEEAKSEGHVAMRSGGVSSSVLKLLGDDSGVDYGDVARVGRSLIEAGELCREVNDEKGIDLVYLVPMWRAEDSLAEKIRGMVGSAAGIGAEAVGELVDAMEAGMGDGFILAPEQRQAVVTALTEQVSVVTGGPGTGKSTITKFIVAGYESLHPGDLLYLAAPTGRAAKRLAEATGRDASTVHRLLGYNPVTGGFVHNEDMPLDGPALMVIDESSMADLELANSLFSAIPRGCQVVIVGDVNQLPSVGPGAVLRDIILSEVVPTTVLKFIYRQEEGSTIGWLADKINRYDELKKVPDLAELAGGVGDFEFWPVESAEEAREAVRQIIEREHGRGIGIMDFQVLTPLRDRGAASAEKLNEVCRDIMNPPGDGVDEKKFGDKVFRDGDKIMKVRKNDYKKMLFNGDLGVAGVDGRQFWFKVDGNGPVLLDGDDLANVELAYSYTTHKSQGSETPLVVVVCIDSHRYMLDRPLIYTAITRGKRRLAIVGSQKAFKGGIRDNKVKHRFGLLRERLRGEI